MEAEQISLPGWARTLAVIVGAFSLIAGLFVLAYPGLGVLFVVFLLGFALVMLGAERIAVGISGHVYRVKVQEQAKTACRPGATSLGLSERGGALLDSDGAPLSFHHTY